MGFQVMCCQQPQQQPRRSAGISEVKNILWRGQPTHSNTIDTPNFPRFFDSDTQGLQGDRSANYVVRFKQTSHRSSTDSYGADH